MLSVHFLSLGSNIDDITRTDFIAFKYIFLFIIFISLQRKFYVLIQEKQLT